MPDVTRPCRVAVRVATVLTASCLMLLVPAGPRAQSPQPSDGPPAGQAPQTPVFRAGVEFVSVDVFPRRDGQVVEGLTAADFQVFEDGTPQAIESFEFVRIEPNPVDSERRDPTSLADGDRQAADPRNRVFVVYLDLAHTTIAGGHHARQPVVDFLKRTIGARDLFGVMTAEIPAAQLAFGRRLESIEGELADYWTWGRAERVTILPTPESLYEERLLNCADLVPAPVVAALPYPGAPTDRFRALAVLLLSLHREDQLVTSLENLMARLGGLRDERKNVLFISEGWVPRGPREELRNLPPSQGALPVIGVGPGGRMGLAQTQPQAVDDPTWCEAEIRRLGNMDFDARFRLLLTSAQQANVSFYPVDVAGLRTSAPLRGAVDTLRTLAENTDGFAVVGTNDLAGGVRRIERDLSAFYLLGYYSGNATANGRFRRIEVKVNTPGLSVSARRGYFAMTPEMAAAAAAPRPTAGPTAVDDALARLVSTRADADLFIMGAAAADAIDVLIEVPADTVRREGWTTGASLRVTARGAGGGSISATATLAAGERAARVSLPTEDIGEGPWQVVVRADGRDGRVEQATSVAAVAATLVGQPLAFRGTPSPRSPLRPAADGRFTRLERLRVEWAVIAPADTHAARLLDRTGQPLGQPLPFTPLPADRAALAVDLPLGALSEGEYLVELVASKGETSERRLLAFRVGR